MARKTKSGRHQIDIFGELKQALEEYGQDIRDASENGLNAAADMLVEKFSAASPVKTGELKESWTYDPKYHGVRYIGSTATGSKNKQGGLIPLVNLLEFGSKGKPFMRKTFDENKDEIIKIIVGEINNGITE